MFVFVTIVELQIDSLNTACEGALKSPIFGAPKDGSSMREQLLCLSDFDYTCVYCVLETSLPVDNCVATLHLTPITDGDRTFAEWSVDFDSNQEKEVSDVLSRDFLQSGLDSLRAGFSST